MHYVIGDVHGCFDELMDLIGKIKRKDSNPTFILVGDLIDRGPKVSQVLEWALENVTEDGMYQCVKGNHEILAIEWFYNDFLEWHKNHKWWKKRMNYPKSEFEFSDEMRFQERLKPDDIRPIIDFFEKMPFSKMVEVKSTSGQSVRYRIVHAWYLYGNVPIEKQHYHNVWNRTETDNILSNEIIVHGHTPTLSLEKSPDAGYINPPGMIAYYRNAINLDGGCVFGEDFDFPYACMLCAICLETLEEIYPYTLAERFVQISKRSKSMDEALNDERIFRQEYMAQENLYRREMLNRLGL